MKYYAIYLVVICVSVFLLQLSFPVITDEFVLISKDALSRPWILVTSIFLHSPTDLTHIFYNMFGLILFGYLLEGIVGSRRFLIIFFVTGIIASIGSAFLLECSVGCLGASGAIMGIIGTVTALRPKMVMYTPFGIMPMIVAAGFYMLIDLGRLYYSVPGIASIAHLFGLGAGIVIGLMIRKKFSIKTRPRKEAISEKDIDKWEDEYMK